MRCTRGRSLSRTARRRRRGTSILRNVSECCDIISTGGLHIDATYMSMTANHGWAPEGDARAVAKWVFATTRGDARHGERRTSAGASHSNKLALHVVGCSHGFTEINAVACISRSHMHMRRALRSYQCSSIRASLGCPFVGTMWHTYHAHQTAPILCADI